MVGERLSSKLALLVQTTCLPELLRGSHDGTSQRRRLVRDGHNRT